MPAPAGTAGRSAATAGVNRSVAVTLRIGVMASAVCIAAGLVLLVAAGGGYRPGAAPSPGPTVVLGGTLSVQPSAVINLGLLLLILTPLVMAAVSLAGFLRERNRGMAGAAGFVLLMLLIGFALGRAGG